MQWTVQALHRRSSVFSYERSAFPALIPSPAASEQPTSCQRPLPRSLLMINVPRSSFMIFLYRTPPGERVSVSLLTLPPRGRWSVDHFAHTPRFDRSSHEMRAKLFEQGYICDQLLVSWPLSRFFTGPLQGVIKKRDPGTQVHVHTESKGRLALRLQN